MSLLQIVVTIMRKHGFQPTHENGRLAADITATIKAAMLMSITKHHPALDSVFVQDLLEAVCPYM